MLKLPRNKWYNKMSKQEEKIKILTQKEFLPAYDKFIQKYDFDMNKLSEHLKSLGYNHNGKILNALKQFLVENKIWKRDGSKITYEGGLNWMVIYFN